MTIAELLELIRNGLNAGTFTEDDSVNVRDLSVSDEAMSAGSNGWSEPSGVLSIGENDQGLAAGIYIELDGGY